MLCMLLSLAACFFYPIAHGESVSTFSLFAEYTSTPSPTLAPTVSPTPAPSVSPLPSPPSGFTLEVLSESAKPDQQDTFRVLIYHTHTYEAYTATEQYPYVSSEKWRTSDPERNMVAVGAYLTQLLESAGVQVEHDVTAFEPPRLSTAYERSLEMLTRRAADGEEYDLYIDLHRDAYVENNGPNTVEINGQSVARIMFLVGKGTGQAGAGYDIRPDWESNRTIAQALTNRLNLQCEGLCRSVSVKSGRYNQHVAACCVLIEVGNNRNTLEEALSAMPFLANAICALADGQVE